VRCPVRLAEIGVDRKHPIRAAANERERLETAEANQPVQDDWFGQRIQLPVFVVEPGFPEKLEFVLPDRLPRQPRVAPEPPRSLRVQAARGPFNAAATLAVQRRDQCDAAGRHHGKHTTPAIHFSTHSHHLVPAVFLPTPKQYSLPSYVPM
jgi:hypothetical protein